MGTFFEQHTILLVYLAVINIITFSLYAVDKARAIRHKTRIRVITLLGFAFFGGALGALLSMYLFRHKTRKKLFVISVPMMLILHIVALLLLIRYGWF